ncbi:ornithine carbamoyltransferase [Leeia sp. TBRC 13508]|uniref:Ornithine carbamoyltransferase n=1 Tax=Leeia speluncae TaxID=2884804 RepID=A0ABS8D2P6_9NEIS|nr:ornithine carbamoyltransferase [Leeia speluncae]MCB6182450.1 ornithine carbamoyltransferase [Leeia speluncae]
MAVKHFLQFSDFTLAEHEYLLRRTAELKRRWKAGEIYQPLAGKVLTMIFEKNSTRTRVAFEAGMAQLGGHAVFLSNNDSQLGRGEPIEDVSRVVSRMTDIVMVRTFEHRIVERFASVSKAPVINALTNEFHPCQIMADIFTFIEHRGDIKGKTVAWIGDANNISYTWRQAAKLFDFQLRAATPKGYEFKDVDGVKYDERHFVQLHDPIAAVKDADIVTTDVCVSMGFERESLQRKMDFEPYEVTTDLMSHAKPDALFMHCLPAHRGEEVAAEVIDGPQSVVWDEAENRMHTQKALLEYLLLGQVD